MWYTISWHTVAWARGSQPAAELQNAHLDGHLCAIPDATVHAAEGALPQQRPQEDIVKGLLARHDHCRPPALVLFHFLPCPDTSSSKLPKANVMPCQVWQLNPEFSRSHGIARAVA